MCSQECGRLAWVIFICPYAGFLFRNIQNRIKITIIVGLAIRIIGDEEFQSCGNSEKSGFIETENK